MRTHNFAAGIVLLITGVAMMVGALLLPVAAIGFISGGLACIGSGAFCIWWSRAIKGTIFDQPHPYGFRTGMAQMASSTAQASTMLAGLAAQHAGPSGSTGTQSTPSQVPARARVLAATDTGVVVNGRSVVDVQLRVDMPGTPQYEATIRQALSPVALAQLFRDADIAVHVDPAQPYRITLGV